MKFDLDENEEDSKRPNYNQNDLMSSLKSSAHNSVFEEGKTYLQNSMFCHIDKKYSKDDSSGMP